MSGRSLPSIALIGVHAVSVVVEIMWGRDVKRCTRAAVAAVVIAGLSACSTGGDTEASRAAGAAEEADRSTTTGPGPETPVEPDGGAEAPGPVEDEPTTTRFDDLPADGWPEEICDHEGFLPRGGDQQAWERAVADLGCRSGGPNGLGDSTWEDGGAASVAFWFGEDTERSFICHRRSVPPVTATSVEMTMFHREVVRTDLPEPVTGLVSVEVATFTDPSSAAMFRRWLQESFDRDCGVTGDLGLDEATWGPAVDAVEGATFAFHSYPSGGGFVLLVGQVGSELVRVEYHGTDEITVYSEMLEIIEQVT